MDIHRSSIADFILPKIRASFVIDYYEGLRNVLEGREDFPYKNLFANPRHRTQTDITWSTDAFTQKPVLLSRLQRGGKRKIFHIAESVHSCRIWTYRSAEARRRQFLVV